MLFAAGVFLSDAGINQQNRGEKWDVGGGGGRVRGWGEEFAPLIFLYFFHVAMTSPGLWSCKRNRFRLNLSSVPIG